MGGKATFERIAFHFGTASKEGEHEGVGPGNPGLRGDC